MTSLRKKITDLGIRGEYADKLVLLMKGLDNEKRKEVLNILAKDNIIKDINKAEALLEEKINKYRTIKYLRALNMIKKELPISSNKKITSRDIKENNYVLDPKYYELAGGE